MPGQKSILFRSEEDWHYNACLVTGARRHHAFTEGYRLAAERLFDSLDEFQTGLDFIIYPTIYLYRHWLELRLKCVIDEGRQLLEDGGGFPKHHEVGNLWPLANGILRRVWPGDPPEYKLIDLVVKDFERFDKTAESFRFPFNTKGGSDLTDLQHVNIRNFVEQMSTVSEFLDGASSGITEYLSEMRSMYDDLR